MTRLNEMKDRAARLRNTPSDELAGVGTSGNKLLANVETDHTALLAAVQAVLDLHKWRCGDWKDHEDRAWYGDHCAECREEWPCDTATTITTALTEAKS